MNVESLATALEKIGQSPCEMYECAKRAQCSSQKLACSSFRYFVKTGRSVDPHIDVPIRITKTQQPMHKELIQASREIFDSMEADDEELIRPEAETKKTQQMWGVINAAIGSQTKLQTIWR